MRRRERRSRLVGPWRSIHGAMWLIGLAILAWQGWWWPGILVLLAISAILEAVLMQMVPQADQDEPLGDSQDPASAASPPASHFQEHRAELLPSTCPNCSGPIRGHEVRWTGPQSADCPYCGTNLPMRVPDRP